MDVVLKVLEGAKSGTQIAVKKENFLIGRSQECHLCAASSAISRRHCVIRRRDASVTVEDLGSRNGTVVNGVKASGETPLRSGDELVVGPLKFLVLISFGVKSDKAPPVQSVAEAVQRASAGSSGVIREDDISRWLLGVADETGSLSETKTIRMDDTGEVLIHSASVPPASSSNPGEAPATPPAAESAEGSPAAEGEKPSKPAADAKGKLPSRSEPTAKDSREAAEQALRNWSRRR